MLRDEIMKIIPHRDPFLMLDEITEMVPERSVRAKLTLTGEEYFFKGHFPGMPVMPGVLIIEAMAQAGACVMLSIPEFAGKIGYFAGIDKARFKRKVFPGDTLELFVEITKRRGSIGFGKGTAHVGGKLAASAEIMFSIGE